MNKALLIAMALALGGCATTSCDEPWSGASCRADRLLYQNDLLQAKILIAAGQEEGYELAHVLLERSAPQDRRGEIEFYQALLLIRQGPEPSEVLRLLEKAGKKGHPHAIALLYKIHQEPYLIEARDLDKADAYRQAYAELDVAQSGYPSFEKALALVSELVEPPPPSASYAPRCPHYCRQE